MNASSIICCCTTKQYEAIIEELRSTMSQKDKSFMVTNGNLGFSFCLVSLVNN